MRAEFRELREEATFVHSVESNLEQFADGGVWFPRRITRETRVNSNVTRREVMDVVEGIFGREIDDQIFTIAGMAELPKGKRFSDRTQGSNEVQLIWDGQNAVTVSGPRVALAQAPSGNGLSRSLLIVACVFGIAFCALTLAWRRSKLARNA